MKKTAALLILALGLGATGSVMAQATCTKQKERYVVQGDTVYDKKTDLTWQRCSIGQRWKEGIGCVGVIKELKFNDAKLNASGSWRLPTLEELQTLVMRDCPEGARINTEVFPDMDTRDHCCYWAESSSRVWYVDFNSGNSNGNPRDDGNAVRLVRGGQ